MLRNVASQKWRVFAWDATTGLAKTGDAANISAYIQKDDAAGAATNDAAPSEVDATNQPGYYDFDMTQAETSAAKLSLAPKSSTSNINVIACPPVVYTVPQYSSLLAIESDGMAHADVKEWLGTAPATPTVAGVPEVDVTHWQGATTVPTNATVVFNTDFAANYNTTLDAWNVNTTHGAGTAWNSGAIGANTLAADTLTAAKLAADVSTELRTAINGGDYALATDANGRVRIVDGTGVGELDTASGVVLAKDHSGANLATAAALDTVDDFLDTEIAAIIATLGVAGAGLTDLGGMSTTMKAQVQTEAEEAIVAKFLDKLVLASGTADSGSTTTMVDAARTEGDADYWKGQVIRFTSGNIDGQCVIITDFNAGTDTFTFSPALTQAVSTQTYVILPNVSAWDDVLADHLTAGTTGNALNAAGSAGDPWATALPGAYGAGSAGYILGTNLNATVSSRASQTSVDTIDGIVDAILDDTGTAGVVVNATGLATDAVEEIRNAITGGAYALDTDANGAIRIVDGTAARELNTSSGVVTAGTVSDKTGYSISGSVTTLDSLYTSLYAARADFGITAAGVQAECEDALETYHLDRIFRTALVTVTGNITPTINTFTTDLTEAANSLQDAVIQFVDGDLAGQTKSIYAQGTSPNGTIQTDEDFTEAPAIGDHAIIMYTHQHSKTQIASTVWANAARTLTAATNITNTGGTTVAQTGDAYGLLGVPTGVNFAADFAAIKAVADSILLDTGTDGVVLTSTGLATSAVEEIRNAITGGAYALDTDANGAVRIVDGTGAREINTSGGYIAGIAGTINTLDALDTAQDVEHDATQAAIAALNNLSTAQVLAQAETALATTTRSVPGQAAPSATPSIAAAVMQIYKILTAKGDQDSSWQRWYAADGTTVDQKRTVSEAAGVATLGALGAGP